MPIHWPDPYFDPINLWNAPHRMTMQSPCVQRCSLDDGTCTGCGRTVEEIREWTVMSASERQTVMTRLADKGKTND